jgi:plasmid stabilization system protein ParE
VKQILWSPQAIRDVESIRAFIAQDSPAYAELIAERLVSAIERLQEFPESGRIVPERPELSDPRGHRASVSNRLPASRQLRRDRDDVQKRTPVSEIILTGGPTSACSRRWPARS